MTEQLVDGFVGANFVSEAQKRLLVYFSQAIAIA